jgi:dynein heavy chain
MLVGPPMGSKTKIINTLLDSFPSIINPKAVSLAELYGNFDLLTQTWYDGLAAKILRESVTTHEYIMFDGPVDAIWVENLNTVLDDSQMLCLSNG